MKAAKSLFVAFLILSTVILTGVVPGNIKPAHAYTVPNSNTGGTAATSDTENLNVANAGDLIVVAVQLHANGAPINVTGLSGTLGDSSYSVAGIDHFSAPDMHCAAACGVSEVFYSNTTSSGTDSITINISTACSSFCPYEMMDVVGIPTPISHIFSSFVQTVNATTLLQTSASLPTLGANSFEVGSAMTSCTNGHVLSPQTGFTDLQNGGSNWGAAMYGTPTTGPPSPTNFQMTCTIGVVNWIDVGVVFQQATITVTQTLQALVVNPCTAFELQCWLYPFFVFGVYTGLILGLARALQVPQRDYNGLLLEALSLASLLGVILGIVNVMMAIIIAVVQVVRAVRE